MTRNTADRERSRLHLAEIPGVVAQAGTGSERADAVPHLAGAGLVLPGRDRHPGSVHADRLDVGRAGVGQGAGCAGLARPGGRCCFVRSRRPYGSHEAAVDAETQFPELGQRLRTVLQYADPATTARAGLAGLAAGTGAPDRSPDRCARLSKADSLAGFRAQGDRSVPRVARRGGHLAREPIAADRRPQDAAPAGSLHHDQRRARRSDPEGRRSVQARGHPRGPAGEIGDWLHRKKNGGDWISAVARAGDRARRARPGRSRACSTASLEDCQEDLEYRVVAGEVAEPGLSGQGRPSPAPQEAAGDDHPSALHAAAAGRRHRWQLERDRGLAGRDRDRARPHTENGRASS